MLVLGAAHADERSTIATVFTPVVRRDVTVVAARRRRRVRMSATIDRGTSIAGAVDPGTVLAALADPTRRDVLAAVAARAGTATATELAAGTPRHQAGDRQASLGVLTNAGLVTSARHGREARYRVVAGSLRPASDWIQRTEASWARRVDRLHEHLADR